MEETLVSGAAVAAVPAGSGTHLGERTRIALGLAPPTRV